MYISCFPKNGSYERVGFFWGDLYLFTLYMCAPEHVLKKSQSSIFFVPLFVIPVIMKTIPASQCTYYSPYLPYIVQNYYDHIEIRMDSIHIGTQAVCAACSLI